MKQVFIYRLFERFWHWSQAILVLLLIYSGLALHFPEWKLLPFGEAYELHAACGFIYLGVIIFAIFWHLTTGEWKQYVPNKANVAEMVHYYCSGIFKNEPHPHHKTELSKHNPLQRLVYFGLNVLVIPVLGVTGFLLYTYNSWGEMGLEGWSFGAVAMIHTLAAFLVMSFLIVHIYMGTTGRTIFSNYKAMITGYEEVPEEE